MGYSSLSAMSDHELLVLLVEYQEFFVKIVIILCISLVFVSAYKFLKSLLSGI